MTTGIAPCEMYKREISPCISTCHVPKAGAIIATYRVVTVYADPNDAPVYARMRYVSKRWEGSIVLQAIARTEHSALSALCEILLDLGINDPLGPALDALEAWHLWKSLPWEQQPTGVRAPKPRRPRHCLRDQHTGKKIWIYKDNLSVRAEDPPKDK